MCSATLHSFDVKKLSEKIMHFPTWVDLKGEDSVPDTVHHVVVPVNPKNDKYWEKIGKNHIRVSSTKYIGIDRIFKDSGIWFQGAHKHLSWNCGIKDQRNGIP